MKAPPAGWSNQSTSVGLGGWQSQSLSQAPYYDSDA